VANLEKDKFFLFGLARANFEIHLIQRGRASLFKDSTRIPGRQTAKREKLTLFISFLRQYL
jgi:hypothetical protein